MLINVTCAFYIISHKQGTCSYAPGHIKTTLCFAFFKKKTLYWLDICRFWFHLQPGCLWMKTWLERTTGTGNYLSRENVNHWVPVGIRTRDRYLDTKFPTHPQLKCWQMIACWYRILFQKRRSCSFIHGHQLKLTRHSSITHCSNLGSRSN